MKLLFVINSEKYPYHTKMLSLFVEAAKKYGTYQIINMADNLLPSVKYEQMVKSGCDLLISFDCAGFEFRTETNTLSYNNFGCRMAHILFRGMHEYREELRQQMNFSMFVFSVRSEDVSAISERYPNIPNIELMERLEYGQCNEEDTRKNRQVIGRWFRHIIEEAELEDVISKSGGMTDNE